MKKYEKWLVEAMLKPEYALSGHIIKRAYFVTAEAAKGYIKDLDKKRYNRISIYKLDREYIFGEDF